MADKSRILTALLTPDPDVNRAFLKPVILLTLLLQEETYSLEEAKLDEKVIEFEKDLVKRSKSLDLFDPKQHDSERVHQYETYRVVLDAAWRSDEGISPDESHLLGVLRERLSISLEEHWLIGCHIKRIPKVKNALHTADEINDARKELQREGILWSYRNENNRNIDVIPFEIAFVIRSELRLELQRINYRRLLQHDAILLNDLRDVLIAKGLDRYGNKADLIERLVQSDIRPSDVLDQLDRQKLSQMCSHVGLRFSADLRAKKLISKDLNTEHYFERATEFLFQVKLNVPIDLSRKDSRADGRLPLDNNQSLLWDCKSVEHAVNLQDFLDLQFDGYLRREAATGRQPLAFLVIGPAFTPQSLKLAHQYKARTNWDVALVTAEGLKHLAERWSTMEPKKPFPIRLLNRTELIDKDRAEFLLSLA